MMEIGTALTDPKVFEPWFSGPSWDGWKAVLRAAFAEKMTKAEADFFRTVASREPPGQRMRELWVIAGRRCGKDSIASVIAAHAAASFDPVASKLRPGERAVVACLAVDRAQAQTVLGYIRSYFTELPALAAMVTAETAEGLALNNCVDIVVLTSDFRSIRGRTVLCVIMDEVAYWPDEHSRSPDREVYRAVRHGMAMLPQAMLIGITTAYRRAGIAYDRWAKHYGRNNKTILVIRAELRTLNPLLPQSEIDEALTEDPEAARADFLSEWRDSITNYILRDLIEAAVDEGVTVRPFDKCHRYTSFVDMSSGQQDSATCAITHKEGDIIFTDCIVEVPAPFDTSKATAHIAAVLKSYGLRETMGDLHAKGWVVAEFARHGITFTARPTEMSRSALYSETQHLYSAGRVRLIDHKRCVAQYLELERRLLPGGGERIDHPNRAGRHDDVCNAVAGALWRASQGGADWMKDIVQSGLLARMAQQPLRQQFGPRRGMQMLLATRQQPDPWPSAKQFNNEEN